MKEHFFDTREALIDALFDTTVQTLGAAVAERATATFIVSGGSSPKPLYQRLAGADLAWNRISIALADERWVDADHDKSNQRMIADTLLQQRAGAARFIPMKTPHATARQGQAACEAAYADLTRPFDFVLLGMGPDAHTASLFPQAIGLSEALDSQAQHSCQAIQATPSATTSGLCERMSLTAPTLLNARAIALLITGDDKRQVFEKCRDQPGSQRDYPIKAILEQDRVPVSVYWAP